MIARHENPQRRGRLELLPQYGFAPYPVMGFQPGRIDIVAQKYDGGAVARNRPVSDGGKGGILLERFPGVSGQDDAICDAGRVGRTNGHGFRGGGPEDERVPAGVVVFPQQPT